MFNFLLFKLAVMRRDVDHLLRLIDIGLVKDRVEGMPNIRPMASGLNGIKSYIGTIEAVIMYMASEAEIPPLEE